MATVFQCQWRRPRSFAAHRRTLFAGTVPSHGQRVWGGRADLSSKALDIPVIFFGTGLVEDNWHDSDESVSLAMLRAGAGTLAHLWADLGGVQVSS